MQGKKLGMGCSGRFAIAPCLSALNRGAGYRGLRSPGHVMLSLGTCRRFGGICQIVGCHLHSVGLKLAQGVCTSCTHENVIIMGDNCLKGKIGKCKLLCISCSAKLGFAGSSGLILDSPWGCIPSSSPVYCRVWKWRPQDDSPRVSVCPSGALIPPRSIIIRGP